MIEVSYKAAVIVLALAVCAGECTAQETTSSGWTDFTNKVKRFFNPASAPDATRPNDDPTALASKSHAGPEIDVAVAELCVSKQEYAEAEQHFRQALDKNKKYVRALTGYARLKSRLGDLPEATKLYETATRSAPTEPSAFNDLGLCYAERGMFRESVTAIDRAIRLKPQNPLYRNNMAMVLVDVGQMGLAYEYLTAIYPEAIAHYNLGYLLAKKGQTAEAARHFTMAAEKDPSMLAARQWLAKLQVAAAPSQPATVSQIMTPSERATAPQIITPSQPVPAPQIVTPSQPATVPQIVTPSEPVPAPQVVRSSQPATAPEATMPTMPSAVARPPQVVEPAPSLPQPATSVQLLPPVQPPAESQPAAASQRPAATAALLPWPGEGPAADSSRFAEHWQRLPPCSSPSPPPAAGNDPSSIFGDSWQQKPNPIRPSVIRLPVTSPATSGPNDTQPPTPPPADAETRK